MWWWLSLALAVSSTGSALGGQGDLDPTFGAAGVARIPLGGGGDSVGGLALQPDGKIVVAASAGSNSTVIRLTGLGKLDVTFAGGKVSSMDSPPVGLVVEGGAIRVGGGDIVVRNANVFLRNYDEDGKVGSRVDTSRTGPNIHAIALARGGAGRVLMLGQTDPYEATGAPRDAVVVAFGSDALDGSFADNGVLNSTRAVADDLARGSGANVVQIRRPSFAVDQESIVLLVEFFTNEFMLSRGLKLLRYETIDALGNSKGQLDGSFGTGGIVDVDYFGPLEGVVLAPQLYPGGKIITAGNTYPDRQYPTYFPEQMWVARTHASGQPDPTFGSGGSGFVFISYSRQVSAFTASVNVAPDGKIVLTGSRNPDQTGPTFYLVRLRADGTLDPTFGGSGVVEEPVTPFERTPQIVVQPNGDILAFGRAASADPQKYDVAVARYVGNPCGDGTIDTGEACDDGAVANGTPDSCCGVTCSFTPRGTGCAGGTCDGAGVCVPPRCGDGMVDPGEQCDAGAGNGTPATCCTAGCQFKPPATACTGGTCNAAGGCVPRGPATCGNGVVEDGEQCDDGNTTSGDCCSATCGIEGASQVCRHSTNPCVKDDHCDGNAPICNVGGFEPPGATVCALANSCTLDDYCDGNGACVPGERVCSADFRTLNGSTGFAVACRSKTAASCTINVRIAGGVTLRAAPPGAGEAAARRACPAEPPPGAAADSLFRGAGAPIKLRDDGGKANDGLRFGRKTTLKLSKEGLRVHRCTELTIESTATITRDDGTQLTLKEQLRLLTKKARARR